MFRQKKFTTQGIFSFILIVICISLIPLGNSAFSMGTNTPEYSQSPETAADTEFLFEDIFITDIDREVNVHEFGTIIIEDTYTIQNNRSSTISKIYICIDNAVMEKLYYTGALDFSGGSLTVRQLETQLFDYTVFEILFNEPLVSFDEKRIIVNLVFNYLYEYETQYGAYTLNNAPIIPISPYPIENINTLVLLPAESTNINVDDPDNYYEVPENEESTSRRFFGEDLEAYAGDETEVTINWINQVNGPVVLKSVDRTIDVNPWGYIRVREEHHLHSYNPGFFYLLNLQIPKGADQIRVYDDLGELLGVEIIPDSNIDGTQNVTIDFRYNRAILGYDREMVYTVEYMMNYEKVHSQNLGTHNINFDLFTTKTYYVMDEVKTRINLMAGRKLERINLPADNLFNTAAGISVEYTSKSITYSHSFFLDITYKVSTFMKLSRGIFFSVILLAIVGIYAATENYRKRGETEDEYISETIPINELTRFIELYEEKNAIMVDLFDLEKKLRNRRVKKKDYNRENKVLSSKLKELNEEIEPFKTELASSTRSIQNVIQKLDYLEAEKLSVQDSMNMLEYRYKKGKLPSKAAYERLAQEMEKRIDAAQKKIDRYINELRAYIV